MGVTGLWDLLSPVGHRVGNDHVRNKVLAVDASIWLTQFVKAMRDAEGAKVRNAHLLGVLRRCIKLLFLYVKPVLIFDGETPAIKRQTLARRYATRERHAAKLRRLAEKLLIIRLKQSALSKVIPAQVAKSAAKKQSRQDTSILDDLDKTIEIEPEHKTEEIDQDEDEEEEVEAVTLPNDLDCLDDDALVGLPSKIQSKVLKQMKIHHRTQHREHMMQRQDDPTAFSETQIDGFLRHTALNNRIKRVRNAINISTGAQNRIASDHTRQYMFKERNNAVTENSELNDYSSDDDDDGHNDDGDVLSRGKSQSRSANNAKPMDILARIRAEKYAINPTFKRVSHHQLSGQHERKKVQNQTGVGWASKVLQGKGGLALNGQHLVNAIQDDDENSSNKSKSDEEGNNSDQWEDGDINDKENKHIQGSEQVAKLNQGNDGIVPKVEEDDDDDDDDDVEWMDGTKDEYEKVNPFSVTEWVRKTEYLPKKGLLSRREAESLGLLSSRKSDDENIERGGNEDAVRKSDRPKLPRLGFSTQGEEERFERARLAQVEWDIDHLKSEQEKGQEDNEGARKETDERYAQLVKRREQMLDILNKFDKTKKASQTIPISLDDDVNGKFEVDNDGSLSSKDNKEETDAKLKERPKLPRIVGSSKREEERYEKVRLAQVEWDLDQLQSTNVSDLNNEDREERDEKLENLNERRRLIIELLKKFDKADERAMKEIENDLKDSKVSNVEKRAFDDIKDNDKIKIKKLTNDKLVSFHKNIGQITEDENQNDSINYDPTEVKLNVVPPTLQESVAQVHSGFQESSVPPSSSKGANKEPNTFKPLKKDEKRIIDVDLREEQVKTKVSEGSHLRKGAIINNVSIINGNGNDKRASSSKHSKPDDGKRKNENKSTQPQQQIDDEVEDITPAPKPTTNKSTEKSQDKGAQYEDAELDEITPMVKTSVHNKEKAKQGDNMKRMETIDSEEEADLQLAIAQSLEEEVKRADTGFTQVDEGIMSNLEMRQSTTTKTEESRVEKEHEKPQSNETSGSKINWNIEDEEAMLITESEELFNGESSKAVFPKEGDGPLSRGDVEKLQQQLAEEEQEIRRQKTSHQAGIETVSDEMYGETRDLLKLLGIPYLQAPMEAEAQCSFLNMNNIVDGIISEDSDSFLFGAVTVYRQLFQNGKFAEVYESIDIFQKLGLNRELLIQLTYLLGSDYTTGVRGVGVVNAMEILEAFNGKDGLKEFKEWMEKVTILDKEPDEHIINDKSKDTIRQRFCWKHRNMKRNWEIRDAQFPNEHVAEAYWKPEVDKNLTKFKWGQVDFNGLAKFCWDKFAWTQEKFNSFIGPLKKELESRGGSQQRRIDEFFKPHRFAKIRSERLQNAVLGMAGGDAEELMAPTLPRVSKRKRNVMSCGTNMDPSETNENNEELEDELMIKALEDVEKSMDSIENKREKSTTKRPSRKRSRK